MTHPPFCRYRRSRGALQFQQRCFLMGKSGIPCFFYGAGIPTDLFAKDAAGSHLQIAPTLAELILPQGETYESLLPSLFDSRRAFNHRLYIENGQIGEEKDLKDKEFKAEIEAARTIAIWRIKMAMRLGQSNKRRYKSILGR